MMSQHQQKGISLIEVMVSLIILALGLLGLAGLHSRSMIMSQSSYYRGIAADLSADLADRIRANRTPYLGSGEDGATPLPPDFSKCTQSGSNADQISCNTQDSNRQAYLVSNEMTEWNSALRAQLPGASFTLVPANSQSAGFLRYTLTVTWVDDRSKTSSSADYNSSYTTVIE
ncbi:type IV pilus modification protein PilV [Jeongeupia naejangsanensis]|uniref:Type IV pilus modification protein PilV n=1 Tax=Jeongeupia naejangsanensis TaxID=613195 RepID=A0ABS2BN65_9NEIS|nr:type IV pilus modification protein PilV [Jeongeupia naejangsanensis]MBM3116451.1 type IV pilus modification protein PilV [Jeongeupia naejangsanensis]